MGKSFNNDIDFSVSSINGLNISTEAIKENTSNQDLKNALKNIDKKENTEDEPKKTNERIKETIKRAEEKKETPLEDEPEIVYTKKTMIFKDEYLKIIDGLAEINDIQIKDVLNQLLEVGINKLDPKAREKAFKLGSKPKPSKTKTETKSIF